MTINSILQIANTITSELLWEELRLSYYQLQLRIQLLSRMCVCKSKLKDISITALLLAGTGTIIHYHYWVLSVTINCHYTCTSCHVYDNKRQRMRLEGLKNLMNTLEHCFSEIIRKFLAHGQRKISTIWLAALGRTIHKAEQLYLLWSGFPGLWRLARWCELMRWHRKSFCIHWTLEGLNK